MREQSWYNGSFTTLAGSYMAYDQWELLSDSPLDMKAAAVWTGPHDFEDFLKCNLSLNVVAWADVQRRRSKDVFLSIVMNLRRLNDVFKPIYDSIPLLNVVEKHFSGNLAEWPTRTRTCSDMNDD